MEISANLIVHLKDTLNTYLAALCNRTFQEIARDTERDFYFKPSEAIDYGIIDKIVQHKRMLSEDILGPSLENRYSESTPASLETTYGSSLPYYYLGSLL